MVELLKQEKLYYNKSVPELLEHSVLRNEGFFTTTGAFRVITGKYTGRSPNDKFFVRRQSSNDIQWGKVNQPMKPKHFQQIYDDMLSYLADKEAFVFDGFAGADSEYRLNIRVINELAWQNLFIRQLLIRPTQEKLAAFKPDYHIICAPGFKADPARHGTNSEAVVAFDLEKKLILIGGTSYAGEIKKSVFTLINYILPKKNVLSMHCSANLGKQGDAALFFGLSGTGKTTLSADPERHLIGDDQHGWSKNGIFNIEGGCYAKCINLNPEDEPQIWNAIRFGTILENVIVDETRTVDFNAKDITENTRAGYPIEYIPNPVIPGIAGHPKNIFFLTADAFGVLPPIARLNTEQAMYHFLSGYTSKLAGTERGITQPEATFSACFSAPFLPLSPVVYANLLGEKLKAYGTKVYLVNTGWTGGPYGIGHRFKINHTRAIIKAALENKLESIPYRKDPYFGFEVPLYCEGVPTEVLNPKNTWSNTAGYDQQAKELAALFQKNFNRFKDIPLNILQAAPAV